MKDEWQEGFVRNPISDTSQRETVFAVSPASSKHWILASRPWPLGKVGLLQLISPKTPPPPCHAAPGGSATRAHAWPLVVPDTHTASHLTDCGCW